MLIQHTTERISECAITLLHCFRSCCLLCYSCAEQDSGQAELEPSLSSVLVSQLHWGGQRTRSALQCFSLAGTGEVPGVQLDGAQHKPDRIYHSLAATGALNNIRILWEISIPARLRQWSSLLTATFIPTFYFLKNV